MNADSHATYTSHKPYPRSDIFASAMEGSTVSFPRLEENILQFWKDNSIFERSLAQRSDAPEYVFYDGPPFANGLPHYGHLLTGYVKDIVPRYKTMQGYLVNRRFGWDTHGLPAELEAQKQLGVADISDIESMGIEKFNDYCQQSVLRYTDAWEDYVYRQARWVDFTNNYKTLDPEYMESVMWAFKKLYEKGLIYQGYKVLPYSWSEQTPLSNQEARLDDSTKPRQDPALTVLLPLIDPPQRFAGAHLIVWTTQAWTLPSNLAAAVHPELEYSLVVDSDQRKIILASSRVQEYAKEFGENYEIVDRFTGAELAGLSYQPPFSYFVGNTNAHTVILADYVSAESGTGIVSQAPAFGEEDFEVCKTYHIEPVFPVDRFGKFNELVPDYQGLNIFEANTPIIKDLKAQGCILRHETVVHAYPHSWRSGEPLIYMAVPSWFVKVTDIKSRMLELNQGIQWIPEHIREGQFGKWLEGAKDWNISRNRYWGSPIPVWVSDDPQFPRVDVYGSLDELERDFGVRPKNLHRPYIDELTRPNPSDPTGQSTMRRVPEVLDCWFESGSMPFASVHYPFENESWFNDHFPGDFIVEYNGQTRGWFYNLLVMSTALFDRAPFRTAATHGIVMGEDGQKMSKSKGNYPDVNLVFNTVGSDASRWYLCSSTLLRGGNFMVTDDGIKESLRQAILPLWQSYSFFSLYAEHTAKEDYTSTDVLDQYILAKLALARDNVTAALDKVALAEANNIIRDFIEVLTNWYIRRSRPRFWAGYEQHPEAFDTLYTVLENLLRLTAPLLPMVSDGLWKGLTGGTSVHLMSWPTLEHISRDTELVSRMDLIQRVCTAATSVRKLHKIRVRQPLQSLVVAGHQAPSLAQYSSIIADEVNVKKVLLTEQVHEYGQEEYSVNARVLGPRLGKKVQEVIKAVKRGEWEKTGDQLLVCGEHLGPEEYEEKLIAKNPEGTSKLPDGQGLVVLDTNITPALEAEGWAKDTIRELQDARKSLGLDISDRIRLDLWVAPEHYQWAHEHQELIAGEILAVEKHITQLPAPENTTDLKDGSRFTITRI